VLDAWFPSALIFLALPLWLSPSSRALILDPSYVTFSNMSWVAG
jgi:hypothetical protein